MKTVAIVGSPRKDGNCDILVNKLLEKIDGEKSLKATKKPCSKISSTAVAHSQLHTWKTLRLAPAAPNDVTDKAALTRFSGIYCIRAHYCYTRSTEDFL